MDLFFTFGRKRKKSWSNMKCLMALHVSRGWRQSVPLFGAAVEVCCLVREVCRCAEWSWGCLNLSKRGWIPKSRNLALFQIKVYLCIYQSALTSCVKRLLSTHWLSPALKSHVEGLPIYTCQGRGLKIKGIYSGFFLIISQSQRSDLSYVGFDSTVDENEL